MTTTITIPVGVARAMNSSAWWTRNKDVVTGDSVIGLLMRHLQGAQQGGYKRNVGQYTAEQAQTLIDMLGVVRGEEELKKTDAAAFEKFIDELGRYLEQRVRVEKRWAEEEAAKQAKQAADHRGFETQQREWPLAVPVESRRAVILRQICEDYGLSLQDPQVRAGLIAAFHAGARVLQASTNDLVFDNGPRTWDIDKWEQRKLRDRTTFEKARELAASKKGESDGRPDES